MKIAKEAYSLETQFGDEEDTKALRLIRILRMPVLPLATAPVQRKPQGKTTTRVLAFADPAPRNRVLRCVSGIGV